MSTRTVIALVGAATTLALAAGQGSALAAPDTTPPSLVTPVTADFVVGSTIGAMTPDADGPTSTGDISMRAAWSASDASGVCGYSTRAEFAGGIGDWSAWSSATSLTDPGITDYDDQFGGGSMKLDGYSVRAKDCAGNVSAAKVVSFRPVVAQEDGATFQYGSVIGTPTYSGTWATASCSCFSGGQTRRTSVASGSVSFTGAQHHTGIVVAKGPDRGKVKVYVGGVLKATVDTYSATKVNRAVVWNGVTSGARVTLVDAATPGHPRFDLDAVLVD